MANVVGVAKPAYLRQIGIDTDEVLSDELLAELNADPAIEFVGRYIDSLTAAEVSRIFATGRSILLFTYANELDPAPRLTELGALGAPAGVTVVLDVESVQLDAASLAAQIDGWSKAILDSGRDAGGYVGSGSGLSATQWGQRLTNRYMKSCSMVVEPPEGFCCEQLYPPDQKVRGVGASGKLLIDYDVMKADYLGRFMNLWAPA